MKKLFSLILSCVIILSLAVVAFAEETTNPAPSEQERLDCVMGDADGDAVLTSADARIILRTAVGLETPEPEVLLCCDMDFSGNIAAPDARLALRTAVGREEISAHSFTVFEKQLPDCKTEGVIKAHCNECEIEASVELKKAPHKYENEDKKCDSEKLCLNCGEMIKQERIVHTLSGGKCIYCDYVNAEYNYDTIVSFVKNSGVLQDGIYYYQENKPECSYAVCYDTASKALYFMGGFYVTMGEDVLEYYIFLDVNSSFTDYIAELDAYQNGEFVLYGVYDVEPSKLSRNAPEALTTKEFEPAEADATSKEQIRVACEGTVIGIVTWADELFTRFGVPCDAEIMGFTALDVNSY